MLQNGQCNSCQAITGCTSVEIDSQGLKCVCKSCLTGYLLDSSSQTCQACTVPRCRLCEGATGSCSGCQDGYGLFSGSCVSCGQANCLNCDSAPASCRLCTSGFFLSQGACRACQTACERCASGVTCLACRAGYYLQEGLCRSSGAHCLAVDSRGLCLRCEYGYFTDNASVCRSCDLGVSGGMRCQGSCAGLVLGGRLVAGLLLGLAVLALAP
jgi:hypothetical protein